MPSRSGHPTQIQAAVSTALATARASLTVLDGAYAPVATAAGLWAANPGGYARARIFLELAIRGCTALADAPSVDVRPYARRGGSTGNVAGGAVTSVARPRLIDAPASVRLQVTTDAGATYTDYSAEVNDNSAATGATVGLLDTAANGDWIVVGGPCPFLGAALNMDAAAVNAVVSAATAEYWSGSAWVALTNLTDGTDAGGASLAGDGQVSWTMPAAGAWATSAINGITAYWARLRFAAQLTGPAPANVEIEECDLLLPIEAYLDVQADGDDVTLLLEAQTAAVTGTLAYAGSVRVSWR